MRAVWVLAALFLVPSASASTAEIGIVSESWRTPIFLADASPVLGEEFVFLPAGNTTLFAVDKDDGDVVWEYNLAPSRGGYRPSVRHPHAPVLVDGLVISQASNRVVAIEQKTGELRWQVSTVHWPATFIPSDNGARGPAVSDDVVAAPCGEHHVCGYRTHTGSLLWQTESPFSASFGGLTAGSGAFWSVTDGQLTTLRPLDGTLSVVGGVGLRPNSVLASDEGVFAVSTNGTVYKWHSDTTLAWTQKLDPSFRFWESPTQADGRLFVSSRTGGLYALDADTGLQLWNNPHLESSHGPAVWDGFVAVGTFENGIRFADAETGESLWFHDVDGQFTDSQPAVEDGVLYIGEPNALHAFALGPSRQAVPPTLSPLAFDHEGAFSVDVRVDGNGSGQALVYAELDGRRVESHERLLHPGEFGRLGEPVRIAFDLNEPAPGLHQVRVDAEPPAKLASVVLWPVDEELPLVAFDWPSAAGGPGQARTVGHNEGGTGQLLWSRPGGVGVGWPSGGYLAVNDRGLAEWTMISPATGQTIEDLTGGRMLSLGNLAATVFEGHVLIDSPTASFTLYGDIVPCPSDVAGIAHGVCLPQFPEVFLLSDRIVVFSPSTGNLTWYTHAGNLLGSAGETNRGCRATAGARGVFRACALSDQAQTIQVESFASDGAIEWTRNVTGEVRALVYAEDQLLVVHKEGVAALSTADGRIVWNRTAPDPMVAYDGIVRVAYGNVIHALSETGEYRWTRTLLGQVLSLAVDGEWTYVAWVNSQATSASAINATGGPVWTRTLLDEPEFVRAILAADGVLIVGTDAGLFGLDVGFLVDNPLAPPGPYEDERRPAQPIPTASFLSILLCATIIIVGRLARRNDESE